ncbi:MAG: hypothetical protein WBA10_10770 [Elainellaceae cyanobacterium]
MTLVLIAGVVASVGGSIILAVQAFKQNLVWGFCYLFAPFASIVFIIKFWAKKPVRDGFFLNLAGVVLILAASAVLEVEHQDNIALLTGEVFETLGTSRLN